MSKCHFPASELHGYSRLAIDATLGVTNIVETIHNNILENVVSVPVQRELTRGITKLVYQSISGITRLVGFGIDTTFAFLSRVDTTASLPAREAVRAALNGVIGDHLKGTANPLAIPMQLRYQGSALR